MCCNGTLFGKVGVDTTEIERLERLGLSIERGDTPIFRQPCAALKDRSCSIYIDRPVICRTYSCALLDRVRGGQVTVVEAQRTIATVRALHDKIATAGSRPLSDISEPDARRAAGAAQLDRGVLTFLLDRHFRRKKKKMRSIGPSATQPG